MSIPNMTTQSYGKYKWNGAVLFLYNTPTGLKLFREGEFYRIQFEAGILSSDFYNKTRAKDNAIKFHQTLDNNED